MKKLFIILLLAAITFTVYAVEPDVTITINAGETVNLAELTTSIPDWDMARVEASNTVLFNGKWSGKSAGYGADTLEFIALGKTDGTIINVYLSKEDF